MASVFLYVPIEETCRADHQKCRNLSSVSGISSRGCRFDRVSSWCFNISLGASVRARGSNMFSKVSRNCLGTDMSSVSNRSIAAEALKSWRISAVMAEAVIMVHLWL